MHSPTLFSVKRCAPPLVLIFACVFSCLEVRGETKSESRIDTLRQLALETLEARGADGPEDVIVDAVLAKFADQCDSPVPPQKAAVTREVCLKKVQDMLQQEAEKKIPLPTDDELAEEAAEEYPIHQVGDPVSISFQTNPVRTSKASGVYRGRSEESLKIGSRSILIRDVRAVPGNEEELLKFFPEQSLEKRRQYIAQRRADVFAQREQWKEEHRDETLRLVLRKQREANEARGYILHENSWRAPAEILARIMPELRKQAREREQRRAADDVADASSAEGGGQTEDVQIPADDEQPQLPHADEHAANGADDAPEAVDTVPDADAPTGESATEVASRGSEAEDGEDDGEAPSKSLDAKTPAPSQEATQKNQEDVSDTRRDGIAVLPILGVIVGGLIAVAAILCWPTKERGRYYPGREQGGNTISDPITRFAETPHVIARFPNRERALSMVAGISCLSLSNKPGRELSCRLPLEYGFAPEEGGTLLGFVAGTAFEYPLWREARDLLHRSRDAELLSAKPPTSEVQVPREGPVADAVSELGQFEGDDHDPSCYWLFQADSREAAKAFLKQVRVKTRGWHVIVQTPQEHLGRDAQGLYQE